MTETAPQLISCDEAGFTGPDLLNEDQPVFAYAAVDLTPAEARAIIDTTRAKHRIQAPELKSKVLRKRPNWPAIAAEVAQAAEGRAIAIATSASISRARPSSTSSSRCLRTTTSCSTGTTCTAFS